MSTRLPARTLVASFLRSFLVQGSWNYRSMIGGGIAFALIPGLKRLHARDPDARTATARTVARHLEHFNAHPYLANLAIGALLRLEVEREAPETVRRFKTAVRGPLGGLGDTLVWASWLPVVSMLALALYWLGASALVTASSFLIVYNIGHVGLRLWGFRAGWAGGRELGTRLAAAGLGAWARRVRSLGVLVLGTLAGALLGGAEGLGGAGLVWTVLGVAGFLLGLNVGHHVWRPAAVAVVTTIAILATWGVIS